jgi:DNA-binding beta-propeller fold protein YncE
MPVPLRSSRVSARPAAPFRLLLSFLLAVALAASAAAMAASGNDTYEVWAIDQSNSPGLTYGGTIYIWDGHEIENLQGPGGPNGERIDLGGAAAALCLARTGANPVRPHMIAVNASQTHAIVSFVASGHVLFLDATTRTPVECIRTSAGAGGSRQVHFAIPSPDETYLSVANQNGKLFERINTDYATNTFELDGAAGINLATCTTPNALPCEDAALRPDNAPICPIIDSTSQYTFVTLRGGGLFVVDSKASPMQIVAEYDRGVVHGNGCLGAEVPGKMYVDSGGGTAGNVFEADLYAFPLGGFSAANPPNVPAPAVVFSEDVTDADAHGATLTKHLEYLWIADRGRNFLWVVDTATDEIVNRIPLAGGLSADPTPDLLALSPNGSHAFMSLRGPNPLTADPHVSTGSTPGVGVLKVTEAGRNARFEAIVPVSHIDGGGVERADVHAMTVRTRR